MVNIIEKGIPTGVSIEDYGVRERTKRIKQVWNNKQGYILDLGCGYGVYTKLLSEMATFAVGLDVEFNFIKEAKKKNSSDDIEFVLASGEYLPFKNEVFDSVFLIETLEHVPHDGRVLREVYRVLKRDGEVIITVPNKYFPFETHSIKIYGRIIEPPIPLFSWLPNKIRKNYERARVYTTNGLTKLLEEIGFCIYSCTYIPPLLIGKSFFKPNGGGKLNTIRKFIGWVFSKTPLKKISMSILICAKR